MSWGGCLPWSVYYRMDHERVARWSCAFITEFHISEMRDDYIAIYH